MEIAVGAGLNLPLYGNQVQHLVGIDLPRECLTPSGRGRSVLGERLDEGVLEWRLAGLPVGGCSRRQ